jgi:hypothetical protein
MSPRGTAALSLPSWVWLMLLCLSILKTKKKEGVEAASSCKLELRARDHNSFQTAGQVGSERGEECRIGVKAFTLLL